MTDIVLEVDDLEIEINSKINLGDK